MWPCCGLDSATKWLCTQTFIIQNHHVIQKFLYHDKPRLIQTSNSLSMYIWKQKSHPWSDKSKMEWLNKSREQVILLSNLIFIQSPRMSSQRGWHYISCHFFWTTQHFRAARFFHHTDSSLLLSNSKILAHKCEKLIPKLLNFTYHSTWAHSAARCWIVIIFLKPLLTSSCSSREPMVLVLILKRFLVGYRSVGLSLVLQISNSNVLGVF
jgi:hypothetical protein